MFSVQMQWEVVNIYLLSLPFEMLSSYWTLPPTTGIWHTYFQTLFWSRDGLLQIVVNWRLAHLLRYCALLALCLKHGCRRKCNVGILLQMVSRVTRKNPIRFNDFLHSPFHQEVHYWGMGSVCLRMHTTFCWWTAINHQIATFQWQCKWCVPLIP
jgi:hypothetical protein